MSPRLVASLAVGALVLVGSSSAAYPGVDGKPLRVLFVGNSFTYTNDLPARVAELAAAPGRKVETGEVTSAGFSLEDHWNQGDARAALATKSWDVVVMQQGPSGLPESQVHLRQWAGRFAAVARAAGTRPGLLGVWPESSRRADLDDVVASYRRAAESAGAELYPAGHAWRAAWRCDRRVQLYGPDGLHPSRLGTYVAALVVYGRLFKAPLLSPSLTPAGVKPRIGRLLQSAAATALGRRLTPAQRCGG